MNNDIVTFLTFETWEFKSEFDDTEQVDIGVVHCEVNKHHPGRLVLECLFFGKQRNIVFKSTNTTLTTLLLLLNIISS